MLDAPRQDDELPRLHVLVAVTELQREVGGPSEVLRKSTANPLRLPTLVQLGERPDSQGLPLLIDLPAWVTSGGDVPEFIARSQPFLSRGVRPQDFARLCGAVHCRFLLNG